MLLPSTDPGLTVRRILKVNHAGETGAINIYAAQIAVARARFAHIVPELDEMRRDEIEHCRLFRPLCRPGSQSPAESCRCGVSAVTSSAMPRP